MSAAKSLILFTSICFLAPLSGCLHFKKSKPVPPVATQVEEEFKQRWIEKRAAALTEKGIRADHARAQAIQEFNQTYPYTTAAHDHQ